MKKKGNLIFIIVLIITLIGLIAFFILRGKTLSTESDEVTNIYKYLGNNDLQICEGLQNYSDKAINYDSLNSSTKICMSYSNLDSEESSMMKIDKTKKNNTCMIKEDIVFATDNYEDNICTISKIDVKKIDEQYKKMFGKTIENYEKFQLDNTTVCYYDDGFYYCGLSENYTYSIGAEPHTYRSIKKVIEKNDTIVIYDYFLKIINDECYENFTTDTKNEKCTNNYQKDKDITYKFLKKNGVEYKHTYKKENGEYHWVKSEPVK